SDGPIGARLTLHARGPGYPRPIPHQLRSLSPGWSDVVAAGSDRRESGIRLEDGFGSALLPGRAERGARAPPKRELPFKRAPSPVSSPCDEEPAEDGHCCP